MSQNIEINGITVPTQLVVFGGVGLGLALLIMVFFSTIKGLSRGQLGLAYAFLGFCAMGLFLLALISQPWLIWAITGVLSLTLLVLLVWLILRALSRNKAIDSQTQIYSTGMQAALLAAHSPKPLMTGQLVAGIYTTSAGYIAQSTPQPTQVQSVLSLLHPAVARDIREAYQSGAQLGQGRKSGQFYLLFRDGDKAAITELEAEYFQELEEEEDSTTPQLPAASAGRRLAGL